MSSVSHSANVLAHELAHSYGLPGITRVPDHSLMMPIYLNRQTIADIQRWRDHDCELTLWDLEEKAARAFDTVLESLLDELLGPAVMEHYPLLFHEIPGMAYGHTSGLARVDWG